MIAQVQDTLLDYIEAGQSYVPLGVIIVALVIVLIVVVAISRGRKVNVKVGGVEVGGDSAATAVATEAVAAVVARMQLNLDQYGEVATALSAVLEAPPAELEAAARRWFSTLATRLAHLLREQGDHHHRVAIWLDGDDPTYFYNIGLGLFTDHDEDMDKLERTHTVAGIAFGSRTGDYYCRDTRTDPQFKPRKTVPPSFHSVYGIALGKPSDPWGVMTVDSRQKNGFPDDRRLLIRRFAELASLGAIVWASRLPADGGRAA